MGKEINGGKIVMNSLEELDKEELLFFIGCYNDYIISFYDTHDKSMQPVCAYEYFDTDFQEILEERAK